MTRPLIATKLLRAEAEARSGGAARGFWSGSEPERGRG